MTPFERSRASLPSNIRKTLEESNLPIAVATAIADYVAELAFERDTLSLRPEEEGSLSIRRELLASAVAWFVPDPNGRGVIIKGCDGVELRKWAEEIMLVLSPPQKSNVPK